MDNNYSVYVHINKINGKKYVGQTSIDPIRRWGGNGYRYKGQVFYNAIEKYGWDNFEHIILKSNLSKEEADNLEIELIDKWNTRNKDNGYNISVGGSSISSTHGMTDSRIYRLWCKMKERCSNPNCEAYAQNGALGIDVCDEWKESFESFYEWAILNDYDDSLQLFRINKEYNYSPDNCYWTTAREKAQRRDATGLYEFKGITKSLYEWSQELGIDSSTLYARIHSLNMSVEEAFTKPVQKRIYLTYHGETHTIYEWSKILNISNSTLRLRYKKFNGDVEKMFETPIQEKFRTNRIEGDN